VTTIQMVLLAGFTTVVANAARPVIVLAVVAAFKSILF